MALSTEITEVGVTATYHRIRIGEITYGKQFMVQGSAGSVVVTIDCYSNKAARDANALPAFTKSVRIYFGADVDDKLSGRFAADSVPAQLAVVRSDEPTRAQLYAAIKSLPEFVDATDI